MPPTPLVAVVAFPPRSRLNRRAYVEARAAGMGAREALALAGSRVWSANAASRQAQRLEGEPEIRAAIDALSEARLDKVRANLDAAWEAGVAWSRDVLEGKASATNMDRIAVLQAVGRALGRFAVKVEAVEHVVTVRGWGFPIPAEPRAEDAPALPAGGPL